MRCWALVAVGVTVCLGACGAPLPETVGTLEDGTLAPCPDTPNCVHTGMRHPEGTEPLYLKDGPELGAVMAELQRIVGEMPRMSVTHVAENCLRAEETSRLFRFVDDLELLVTQERELIVRSASRVGRSDLGVNARRVERLRGLFAEAGLLR